MRHAYTGARCVQRFQNRPDGHPSHAKYARLMLRILQRRARANHCGEPSHANVTISPLRRARLVPRPSSPSDCSGRLLCPTTLSDYTVRLLCPTTLSGISVCAISYRSWSCRAARNMGVLLHYISGDTLSGIAVSLWRQEPIFFAVATLSPAGLVLRGRRVVFDKGINNVVLE